MDYKESIILPNTPFPMRGNLPENEKKIYERWHEEDIYNNKMRIYNKDCPLFTLHDGPPYANGNIHIGHALNKILKDIVSKIAFFDNKHIAFTPGWDCHGLPIEQKVEEKITKNKKDTLSKSKFRELCRNWADDFIKIQSKEFQSLGVLADFKNPYKTMNFAFEAQIYEALCNIAQKHILKRRLKPIFWSWAARSALAEAEVEYREKEDYSLFVSFPLQETSKSKLGLADMKNEKGEKEIYAVIWTTTPWTLPSNQAIALNPSEKYALTKEGYIFASAMIEKIKEKGLSKGEVVREFVAKDLELLKATNPINGRDSVFVLGKHVLMGEGSGLVHTAPGFGEDDYFTCLKYGIPVVMPVDDGGCFDEKIKHFGLFYEDVIEEMLGKHVFSTNERIIELLGAHVLSVSKFTHSYPYCWRTHKPIIYRATTQWFILMDEPFANGKTLRQIALDELKNVRFYPEVGRNRIQGMLELRPDWCISRQRDWGVPIAFFIDKASDEVLLDSEVLEHIQRIFAKEGCDAWWDKEIIELLPESYKDRAEGLEKSMDILDVWFDSGSTWKAVLNSDEAKSIYPNAGVYPANLYLEGSDQHRGWFQSSLLVSCALHQKAPYKNVLTHGFTMDENGQKMSKSLGNTIAPQDVQKEYGGEILRLWVALSDYQNDQRISKNILKRISEQYKKMRNTIRFLLANTSDLVKIHPISSNIDAYFLHIAQRELESAHKCFKEYDFSKGLNIIMNFISAQLSGIYMDICKDSLYCDGLDSAHRLSIQSTMALILDKLLFTIAPILTYTANEAYEYMCPALKNGDIFSLRNKNITKPHIVHDVASMEQEFTILMAIREKFSEIIDDLKKDKTIKSTLELCIISQRPYKNLDDWLIVSQARSDNDFIHTNNETKTKVIKTFEVNGEMFSIVFSSMYKCPRCWKFTSQNEEMPCQRCQEVLNKQH